LCDNYQSYFLYSRLDLFLGARKYCKDLPVKNSYICFEFRQPRDRIALTLLNNVLIH